MSSGVGEEFKNGEARLGCRWHCALTWGLYRNEANGLYKAQAWSDLALNVLRIGYGDDLSYFYLGKAAEGLGHIRAAETYYRLSRSADLKCADIYGECYGLVFPRDARLTANAAVKNNTESKRQSAGPQRSRDAAVADEPTVPAPAPEPQPKPAEQSETRVSDAGEARKTQEEKPATTRSIPPEPAKRPPAAKKPPPPKPVQQAESGNARAVEEKPPETPAKAAKPVITFQEVSEKFGTQSRLTEAQKREAWKKYQGRCVQWSGELSYVGESFIRGLTLGFKHNPRTLTYDVLVSAPDNERDAAQNMKKGAHYSYRGTLKKYGGPILPISMDWGCRGEQSPTEHAKAE